LSFRLFRGDSWFGLFAFSTNGQISCKISRESQKPKVKNVFRMRPIIIPLFQPDNYPADLHVLSPLWEFFCGYFDYYGACCGAFSEDMISTFLQRFPSLQRMVVSYLIETGWQFNCNLLHRPSPSSIAWFQQLQTKYRYHTKIINEDVKSRLEMEWYYNGCWMNIIIIICFAFLVVHNKVTYYCCCFSYTYIIPICICK